MDSTSPIKPRASGSSYSLDDWILQTGQSVPEQDSERWVSYNISDLYPEWHTKAHCAGVGVSYYFGDDKEQPTMSIRQVRAASKLCDVCPVFKECLTWALSTREEYGVWAGTSGRVRRRIFKMMDNGLTDVAEVVERFCDGQGDIYRFPQGQRSTKASPSAYPVAEVVTFEEFGHRPGEGQHDLPAEGRGEAAL